MPRKYKKNYRKKRKPYWKNKKGAITRYRAPPKLSGTVGLFGSHTVKRKMRYIQNVTLTSTSGAIAYNIFSANSAYDPDTTGVGHQPRAFDQIMPYFQHFCVVGSKMTVTFNATSNVSHEDNPVVGISLRGTATPQSSYQDYAECADTSWAVMGLAYTHRKLVKKCSVKKYLGKNSVMDNYDLKGTVSSSPAEDIYYHVWMDPIIGVDNSAVNALVLIDYITIFSEPKTLAVS